MTPKEEKELEQLGAFEIAFKMLSLAKNDHKESVFLNAGRGNPNWIQTISRLAFAKLVQFGVAESKRTIDMNDMAGYTTLEGIYDRLTAFLDPEHVEEDDFLLRAITYAHDALGLGKDAFVKELVDGVIGNNYPVPSRILKGSEKVINAYLSSTLYHRCQDAHLAEHTQLFPTEGGTAAIVYIFNSLKENHLIYPGDKIMINTPIFTPYIEIPELDDYQMEEIYLQSKEDNHWAITPEEISRVADPEVKALFLVNPSNPGSVAINDKTLAALKEAVQKNPDLMIITDDVYGTFAKDFQSVYSVVPYNTLLVYSYSKLYGATGWRLGVIAMHEHNVFDDLLSRLSEDEAQRLYNRYRHVVLDPNQLSFIDRMVADSRSVGLYHTAGLSTPQQIMEVLFSLAHLLNIHDTNADVDSYIEEAKHLVRQRYDDLHEGLETKGFDNPTNAAYYSLIDIYQLAAQYYDEDFSTWLKENFEQIDFLVELSEKNGVVLMDGVGFGSNPGILRVSQANLPNEAYAMIARQIRDLMEDYHTRYIQQTK